MFESGKVSDQPSITGRNWPIPRNSFDPGDLICGYVGRGSKSLKRNNTVLGLWTIDRVHESLLLDTWPKAIPRVGSSNSIAKPRTVRAAYPGQIAIPTRTWLSSGTGMQSRRMRRQPLVVGCGLGDDAEQLAAWGLKTTAFDISQSAIRA